MSAANPESVTAANRDALRASASASVAPSAALPATTAAAASSSAALPSVDDELAAVKQRILLVDGDIARVEKQLTAAVEKRDRFEGDEKKWERYDGDVQRLSKEKQQLRDEKALLLEQLRDELKRKEQAGQCGYRAARYMRCDACALAQCLLCVLLLL